MNEERPLKRSEIDQGRQSPLHTLGLGANQAMPGNIISELTVTGSRTSGTAVASIIAILAQLGVQDASTP